MKQISGKLLMNLLVIAIAATSIGTGINAYFSDTETAAGNTFTAGSLDLEVDGQSGAVVPWTSPDNMEPGKTYFTGFKTLTNVGTLDGNLTVTIENLVCDENGLLPPEIAAGDSPGTQLDPDGFSQESGDGELWDQILFSFVIDDGDGVRDWQDKTIGLYPDESSYYSIRVGKPIVLDDDFVAGESMDVGIEIKFLDDAWTSYGWILDGVLNNAAMSDRISLDLKFELTQKK